MRFRCKFGIHSFHRARNDNELMTERDLTWDEECEFCHKVRRVGFELAHNAETELRKIRKLLEIYQKEKTNSC